MRSGLGRMATTLCWIHKVEYGPEFLILCVFPVTFFFFLHLSLVQYITVYLLLLLIYSFPLLSCRDFPFLSLLAYPII